MVRKYEFTLFKIALLCLLMLITNEHKRGRRRCGAHLLKTEISSVNVYEGESETQRKKRFLAVPWEQIRIKIDYTTLDSQTTIDQTKRDNLKKVIDQTASLYTALISVQRFTVPIKIPSCGTSIVTSDVKAGINYDMIIFPKFDPTYDALTEAAAAPCQNDALSGKPIAGYINFSVEGFKTNSKNWLEYYTYLAWHELFHIFVMHEFFFDKFIDSNGVTIPKNKVIGYQDVNGVNRTQIISPGVVSAAKKHYNCTDVQGVLLEDQGGDGTAGNHWEERTMLTDILIGESYDEVTISEITLAFLDDSGWYKTNKYTGGLFRHGKMEGCSFLYGKCIVNEVSPFPNDFCYKSNFLTCTSGRIAKGFCYMPTPAQSINSIYKYFSSGLVGSMLADYCPVSRSSTTGDKFYTNCVSGTSSLPASLKEYMGTSSTCIYSTVIDSSDPNKSSYSSNYTICLKFSCNYSKKVLTLFVGSTSFDCPTAGGKIEVVDGTRKGQLFCPDYNLICNQSTPCDNIIDCINKKSTTVYETYTYTLKGELTSQNGVKNASGNTIINSSNSRLVVSLFVLLLAILCFL